MKTILTLLTFLVLLFFKANAQIYSAGYIGYSGLGTIFYPNGVYKGFVYNGYANGSGTFYWADGSFFTGNFYAGFYNGPGLFVSRLYGYVTGCWNGGLYVGPCTNGINPYDNSNRVRQEVETVQTIIPKNNNNNIVTHDPDGYAIRRIDANSEVGQQLLGRSF